MDSRLAVPCDTLDRMLDMRWLYLMASAVLLAASQPASTYARGPVGGEDQWNPEHISQLPAEVRSAVMRMCVHPPVAEHYFATYFQDSRLIKLHFEHFRCAGSGPFCNQTGCLHQEYGLTGGRYQLLKSFYAPPSD
jgi:hypothetical protein